MIHKTKHKNWCLGHETNCNHNPIHPWIYKLFQSNFQLSPIFVYFCFHAVKLNSRETGEREEWVRRRLANVLLRSRRKNCLRENIFFFILHRCWVQQASGNKRIAFVRLLSWILLHVCISLTQGRLEHCSTAASVSLQHAASFSAVIKNKPGQ